MSKQRNKVIALALAGACGFGVWQVGQALLGADEAQGTKHAVNQLWINHVPRDDRDMVTHFVLIDHPQGQFGSIGHSSQWRHIIDVFRWQLQDDTLGMYFPQERARAQVKVETWRCEGEAPAPFELCMKLTNQKGRSFVFYSRDEWKIEPRGVADSFADIVEDAPELAGRLHEIEASEAEQLGELDLDEAQRWPLEQVF